MKYLLFLIVLTFTPNIFAKQNHAVIAPEITNHLCSIFYATKDNKIEWAENTTDVFYYIYDINNYFASLAITSTKARLLVKKKLSANTKEIIINGRDCSCIIELFGYLSDRYVEADISSFINEADKQLNNE